MTHRNLLVRTALSMLLLAAGATAEVVELAAVPVQPPLGPEWTVLWAGLSATREAAVLAATMGRGCEIRSRWLCEPDAQGVVECRYRPVDWECRQVERVLHRLPGSVSVSRPDNEIRFTDGSGRVHPIADYGDLGDKPLVVPFWGVEVRFTPAGSKLVLDLEALRSALAERRFPQLHGERR